MTSFNPDYLHKALSSDTVTLGVGASAWIWEVHNSVYDISQQRRFNGIIKHSHVIQEKSRKKTFFKKEHNKIVLKAGWGGDIETKMRKHSNNITKETEKKGDLQAPMPTNIFINQKETLKQIRQTQNTEDNRTFHFTVKLLITSLH